MKNMYKIIILFIVLLKSLYIKYNIHRIYNYLFHFCVYCLHKHNYKYDLDNNNHHHIYKVIVSRSNILMFSFLTFKKTIHSPYVTLDGDIPSNRIMSKVLSVFLIKLFVFQELIKYFYSFLTNYP